MSPEPYDGPDRLRPGDAALCLAGIGLIGLCAWCIFTATHLGRPGAVFKHRTGEAFAIPGDSTTSTKGAAP